MRDRGNIPTWLERRGYSRRLKRLLARHAVRRRSRLRRPVPASQIPSGSNVVPFPVRPRVRAVG